MNYTKCLEQFVKAGTELWILNDSQVCKSAKRLLVLDSSFNPPHLAHYALACEALMHDFGDENSKEIVLLLSIKNADKSGSDLQSFSHRMSMMSLMAKSLESLKVNVSIGLTDCAKFADKARCLGERYPDATLTFLLGFDTLVRVLDPKYYLPSSLADSLAEFMSNSELFCLTRAGTEEDIEFQQNYVDNIANGRFPGIPSAWAKRIFVESLSKSQNSIDSVSSTNIRNSFSGGTPSKLPLLKEIEEYIKTEKLYSEK